MLGVIALAGAYWFPVRRWFSRWGTKREELERGMPGDRLIPDPTNMSTGAVTVNAPPEAIWPWPAIAGYARRLLSAGSRGGSVALAPLPRLTLDPFAD
jgi:hypothetical protein